MSSRSDQYDDQTYRQDETEEHGGFFSYPPWGWSGTQGVWPFSREAETRYDEGTGDSRYNEDDSESLWDEALITLLIVGGGILFLIPEPGSSAIGVMLMAAGVIGWVIDWALY